MTETLEEMKIMPMMQQNKTFTTEFRGVRYDYYLTGAIGDPEEYLDLCNILRTAGPQDEVIIRFNTPGGQVRTGNMIINAISESEATVVGFIESDCGSMGTYIFLACDTWAVSEAAEFFAHTCSYGTFGKESECFSQMEFMRKQQHKMIRKRYSNFLDEQQIETILLGGDIYLDSDEIMERLVGYAEARQAEGCGDENCTECGEQSEDSPFSIQDMIKEAVTEAISDLRKDFDFVPKQKPTSKPKSRAKTSEKVVD